MQLVLQMNYNNKANLVGAMLVAGFDKTSGGQVGRNTSRAVTKAMDRDNEPPIHNCCDSALAPHINMTSAYGCCAVSILSASAPHNRLCPSAIAH